MAGRPTVLLMAMGLIATSLCPALVEARGGDKPKTTDPRMAPPLQPAVPIVSSVTVNPPSVTGGTLLNGTVALLQPAPSGGVTVKLQSTDPKIAAVPSSVVVQPGATSALFVVQTYPMVQNPNVVTSPPSVDISAQIGNSTPRATKLTVLPATLNALTLDPASVPGGSTSTGRVTITGPAPSGGLAVALSTTSPAATAPQQVTIAAGVAETTFPLTTKWVAASTTVQITASRGAFVTKTATLTVLPPRLAALSFTSVVGGLPATGTVNLTSPAPSEGMPVQVGVLNPASTTCWRSPTIPSSVTVPGGATSVTFPVTTYPTWHQLFQVSASAAGGSVAGQIGVKYPSIASVTVPPSAQGGSTIQGTVRLDGPALSPSCLIKFKLTSSNTLYAQVPPEAPFAASATQANFPITTSAPLTTQTVNITVRRVGDNYEGHYKQVTLNITP